MKMTPSDRFAAVVGCVLTAAVCVWWLAATRLALEHTRDPARIAGDALQALVVTRAVGLAILTARTSAASSWLHAMRAGCIVLAQGWPVVLLAWSASAVAASRVIATEATLLGAAAVAATLGWGVQRLLARPRLALMLNTIAGLGLATLIWSAPAMWRMPPV